MKAVLFILTLAIASQDYLAHAQFFAKVEQGYFYNGNLIRADLAAEKRLRVEKDEEFQATAKMHMDMISKEISEGDYNTWKERGSKYLEDGKTEIVENQDIDHSECNPRAPVGFGDATYKHVNEDIMLRSSSSQAIKDAIYDFPAENVTSGWTLIRSTGDLYTEETSVDEFSSLFEDSSSKIIRVVCESCDSLSHQEIFYKRLTPAPADMLDIIERDWRSSSNTFNVDFKLYSSYSDAANDENAWTFCGGFNVEGQGFPGTCGPLGEVTDQWMSIDIKELQSPEFGQPDVAIFVESAMAADDIASWEQELEEERMNNPQEAKKRGLCWHLPLRDDRRACWRACDAGVNGGDLGALKLCEDLKSKGQYWKATNYALEAEVLEGTGPDKAVKPTHALGSDTGLPGLGTY